MSESTAELLGDGYELSDLRTVELKGKEHTPVRFLLGRVGETASIDVLEVRQTLASDRLDRAPRRVE